MNLKLKIKNFVDCPKIEKNSISFDSWSFPKLNQYVIRLFKPIGIAILLAFFLNSIYLIINFFIIENAFDLNFFFKFLTWDIPIDDKREQVFYQLGIPIAIILNIFYSTYFMIKLLFFKRKPILNLNDLNNNWELVKKKFDSFESPILFIVFIAIGIWWLEFSILVNISSDMVWILIYIIPPILAVSYFITQILWRIYQRYTFKKRLMKYYTNLIIKVQKDNNKSDYIYQKIILNDLEKISIINISKKYLLILIFPLLPFVNPILDLIRIFTF
ncbi:MAG: hypothetical protein HeimC3_39600 [Candidatus Heimdallarchaeota archaeon LC_3]|nr:MAG: hypothetical protein HeimC3_39600 [Candidatus Heimdallarchaeota archaeon LC_3]